MPAVRRHREGEAMTLDELQAHVWEQLPTVPRTLGGRRIVNRIVRRAVKGWPSREVNISVNYWYCHWKAIEPAGISEPLPSLLISPKAF